MVIETAFDQWPFKCWICSNVALKAHKRAFDYLNVELILILHRKTNKSYFDYSNEWHSLLVNRDRPSSQDQLTLHYKDKSQLNFAIEFIKQP